jgi:hypothetical protein
MIASGGAKKCFFQWNVCLCHFVINRVIGMISKKLNPCFQKIKDKYPFDSDLIPLVCLRPFFLQKQFKFILISADRVFKQENEKNKEVNPKNQALYDVNPD